MTPSDLLAFRTARGWTQREMADQIGKSDRAILKYEKDGAEVPKAVSLAVLAHEFNDALTKGDTAALYRLRARFSQALEQTP